MQQAVRPSGTRLVDLRTEAEQCFDAGESAHAHPQIDDDELRIGGKIDGAQVNICFHGESPYFS